MRILYGVVGEGMGHAMRSRVILEHLIREGHTVTIMASGRAVDFLKKRFDGVTQIHGLHMIYEENRVKKGRTLWSNVLSGAKGIPGNIAKYFDSIGAESPDAVISDFESWTYLYSKLHNLPVLSIDNMQIINRCTLSEDLLGGHEADFQIAKAFVKGKLPFCDDYYVTTFFYPPTRKPKTRLFPPILRPEILAATPTDGEHLLVYQTAEGNDALLDALKKHGVSARVYGMRRGLESDLTDGSVVHRPFSEAGFIADLASCQGVVAGGGFTLMGEAVYLRKPMLATPLAGQFEQLLNSRYLEKMGFGKVAEVVDDVALATFLQAIPRLKENLSGYTQDGNRLILEGVTQFLDRVAGGVA